MSSAHADASLRATLKFAQAGSRPGSVVNDPFARAIRTCCVDLFQAYGLSLYEVEPPARDCDLAGVIGFTSEQVSGTLVLASRQVTIAGTCPIRADDVMEIHDWIAELANQLLGRLKNMLSPYGIVLQVSTPIVMAGENLSCFLDRESRASGDQEPLAFASERGSVAVWAHVRVENGVIFAAAPAKDYAPEGTLELF